eukprot:SAG22_NODE_3903_length_1476_cov_1.037763_1_plen_426_part_01
MAKQTWRPCARRPRQPEGETLNKMAQSWGHWASSPTQPVEVPALHLLALAVYAALMVAYFVYVIVLWVDFVQPVLFESQLTSAHKAVPLTFAIDCQDCREDRVRAPDSSLWMLRWDYSAVPGGCAAKNGGEFSDELRQFCAAQNAPPPPAASGSPVYLHMKDTHCQVALIQPGLLLPSVPGLGPSAFPGPGAWPFPFSIEAGVPECQAKCDANPSCEAFLWSPPLYRVREAPMNMNNTCCECALKAPHLLCVCRHIFLLTIVGLRGCDARTALLRFSDLLSTMRKCAVEIPTPGTDLYFRRPPPPAPFAALVDPLDRCTITSNDAAFFRRSPSPEPWVLTSPAQLLGMGDNPNYIGPGGRASYTRTRRDGPEGLGSFYELQVAVPMCYAGDDSLDGSGMSLEIMNIPHHAFADPLKIGQDVVTVSS